MQAFIYRPYVFSFTCRHAFIYRQHIFSFTCRHTFIYRQHIFSFTGHSVGGTNPSLLEAMATGCTIAAHDNIFNKAILNEQGFFFADAKQVQVIIDNIPNPSQLESWKEKNLKKVKMFYNWSKIIDQYEEVFIRGPR